jgi:hypothetical protein
VTTTNVFDLEASAGIDFKNGRTAALARPVFTKLRLVIDLFINLPLSKSYVETLCNIDMTSKSLFQLTKICLSCTEGRL